MEDPNMVSLSQSAAAETLISLEKSMKCDEIEESIEPFVNFISIQDASTVEDITTEHHVVEEEILNETLDLNGSFQCFQCEYSFSSLNQLSRHFADHRSGFPFTCFLCQMECMNKEDFVTHSQSHLGSTLYKCPTCLFETDQIDEIETHMKSGHSDNHSEIGKTHQCPICEKNFETQMRLKNHLNKCSIKYTQSAEAEEISVEDLANDMLEVGVKEELDENSAVYTCPICFFIFTCKLKASKHIATVHFQASKKASVVELEAPSEVDSDVEALPPLDHEEDMNPSVALERIYLCPVCHYVFTSGSALNKHLVTHKNVTECPICQFECETNAELKNHLATHLSDETKSSCSVCNRNFPSVDQLGKHIRKEHSKTFKCPYCPRSIKTENALKLHIESHSKLKEFYCPKCKFSAKNSSVLQFHMSRYHRPKKEFACKFCGKAYKFKFSLQRHTENCSGKDIDIQIQNQIESNSAVIEIDTSQKQTLNCSECGDIFKDSALLKDHLLEHYKKCPYRCFKCGERCKSKYLLSKHLKTHKISAKYECRVCHKKFPVKHALNNHLISHNEERPFTCDICGLKFKRKYNYRRHYDSHTDSKSFKCSQCSYAATRKDLLLKHVSLEHDSA